MLSDVCQRYQKIKTQIDLYEDIIDLLEYSKTIRIKVIKSSFNPDSTFYQEMCDKLHLHIQEKIIPKRIKQLRKELEDFSKFEQHFINLMEEEEWKDFVDLLKL